MDFPGKNTGVGCLFLLQGGLPNPGVESASPALAGGFFTAEPPGKSIYWVYLMVTKANSHISQIAGTF